MLDNWQRIEKLVKWTGLSVNAFARGIGLNRGENLYQIKRGNYGISKDLAQMICVKYPNVSKSWLLTGTGEMFVEDVSLSVRRIPFYNMDITDLVSTLDNVSPSGYMNLPMVDHCDFAATVSSDSMSPRIAAASVVCVEGVDAESILPGNDYLIISSRFTGIRCIRQDEPNNKLRLVPRNKEDYDDICIDRDDISSVYAVRCVINKF